MQYWKRHNKIFRCIITSFLYACAVRLHNKLYLIPFSLCMLCFLGNWIFTHSFHAAISLLFFCYCSCFCFLCLFCLFSVFAHFHLVFNLPPILQLFWPSLPRGSALLFYFPWSFVIAFACFFLFCCSPQSLFCILPFCELFSLSSFSLVSLFFLHQVFLIWLLTGFKPIPPVLVFASFWSPSLLGPFFLLCDCLQSFFICLFDNEITQFVCVYVCMCAFMNITTFFLCILFSLLISLHFSSLSTSF